MIFQRLNLDTLDVLEAAGSKWNFLPFRPGLVGGHCIPVDPYYLMDDLKKKKFKSYIISNSRRFNENFTKYIANRILKLLKNKKKNILFLGINFKENVIDFRNSKYYK